MDDMPVRIERAKKELERMIDLNPAVMLLVDRAGTIVRANRALLSLLGAGAFSDILGHPFSEIFAGGEVLFEPSAPAGADVVREAEIEMPDGRKRTFQITLVGAGRDADVSVIVIRDLTDERRLSQTREVETKKEAVNALAGALAHRINQSLTVIVVRAHLLQRMLDRQAVEDTEIRRNLQDVVDEAAQIADVLHLAATPRDYVTEPYVGNARILDLERSSGAAADTPDARTDDDAIGWAAIQTLMRTLDIRHCGTLLRARRIAAYSARLARQMQSADGDVARIESCARVHNIGEIGVPDAILQKTTPLTRAESALMESHAAVGYELLRAFPFAREEADVAYAHHERFDGTGYPRRLAGEAIHPKARIVALAHALDALRFGPAYERRTQSDRIVAEIVSGAGSQFDPAVVHAFRNCAPELLAMFGPDTGGPSTT